jgi:hypothetical protein
MSTPVLLEKEASLLRYIYRAEEYPSVGVALAVYQEAHGMEVSLMVVPGATHCAGCRLGQRRAEGLDRQKVVPRLRRLPRQAHPGGG